MLRGLVLLNVVAHVALYVDFIKYGVPKTKELKSYGNGLGSVILFSV